MSELPAGFVLDAQQPAQGLPAGFVLDQGAAPAPAKPFGLMDTWPVRMAKSIGSAMALPGDVYQGNAAVPQSANMGQENTANIGRATDLAAIASPMAPRASMRPRGVPPTQEELAAAGGAGYNEARGLGVELAPQSVQGMAQALGARLNEKGIDAELAKKTFAQVSKLENPPEGAVSSTIGNMESARRAFGHAGQDFTNPTERLAARTAQSHLDDYLAGLSPVDTLSGDAAKAAGILKDARGNYAAGMRAETVGDAVRSAELGAAAANSGRNIGNAERQKFKSLVLNEKDTAGFSPQELAQVEKIVRGTVTGNTARHLGNLLGGGGGLGQLGGIYAGAAFGGPVGAVAAPTIGNLARMLANRSTERQVGKLDEMVRSRSPLGEQRAGEMPQVLNDQQRAALAKLLMQSRQQQ